MSDVGLFLIMFAVLVALVALIRFLSWLTELQEAHGSVPRAALHTVQRYVAVKRSEDTAPIVMSRSEDEAAVSPLSDLRQTEPQTDRPAYNRAGMLDIYRLMRKYNIPREEARQALQAASLPLDNNQWAKVAPAADDALHITPIVGRPTRAQFETDPDYPYQAPA